MNSCKLGTDYLNEHLSPSEARAFEAHIDECAACRDEVYKWRTFERSLKRWAEGGRHCAPTRAEAQQLMARAERPSFNPLRPLVLTTASVAVAVTFLIVWILVYGNETPAPAQRSIPLLVALHEGGRSTEPGAMTEETRDLVAPAAGNLVADIGTDRIGLSPGGEMRLLEAANRTVRLELLKGTVACRVSSRKNGGRFIVEAGGYRVRVVGTQFKVSVSEGDGFSVAVEKGIVEVSSAAGVTWRLGQGDAFEVAAHGEIRSNRARTDEIAMLHDLLEVHTGAVATATKARDTSAPPAPRIAESPATAKLPQVETGRQFYAEETGNPGTWRGWLLNGRADEARAAMQRHLKRRPQDAETWTLLGDCERKTEHWDLAVKAYDKARAHGNSEQASHATYMMATVYQKNLRNDARAVEMFALYKRSGYVPKELEDLTDVHMARSLIAISRKAEAKALLESVIAHQKDSFVGSNAKKLLKKCEDER